MRVIEENCGVSRRQMSVRVRAVWAIAVVGAFHAAPADAQVSVSRGGRQSYCDIAVPPRIADMSTYLSLFHTGGGVDGPFGHEWTLTGGVADHALLRKPCDRWPVDRGGPRASREPLPRRTTIDSDKHARRSCGDYTSHQHARRGRWAALLQGVAPATTSNHRLSRRECAQVCVGCSSLP
jgi:hypothetical protein